MKNIWGPNPCERLARDAARGVARVQDLEGEGQASKWPAEAARVARSRGKLASAIEARDRAIDRLEKFARDKKREYEGERNLLFTPNGEREYSVEELTHRLMA